MAQGFQPRLQYMLATIALSAPERPREKTRVERLDSWHVEKDDLGDGVHRQNPTEDALQSLATAH